MHSIIVDLVVLCNLKPKCSKSSGRAFTGRLVNGSDLREKFQTQHFSTRTVVVEELAACSLPCTWYRDDVWSYSLCRMLDGATFWTSLGHGSHDNCCNSRCPRLIRRGRWAWSGLCLLYVLCDHDVWASCRIGSWWSSISSIQQANSLSLVQFLGLAKLEEFF